MSSRSKLPSVTPPHIVGACTAMIGQVRAHTNTSLFANIIRDHGNSIAVVCADQTTATLKKVTTSTTGPFTGIGYNFIVEKPGIALEDLSIYIHGPSDSDLEVNRRYLIQVLYDIIDNPHVGKKVFNGGVPQ